MDDIDAPSMSVCAGLAGRNMRVISTSQDGPAPFYRVSQMSYDSIDDLRAGIASDDGQSTIADLANFATGGATLLIVEEDTSA
jgi:uncharacterized protein (TIGR02118 family)